MPYIYYIETNLICIVLLLIVYSRVRSNHGTVSSAQLILRRVFFATTLLCLSDMIASLLSGRHFRGAWIASQFFNLLFFEMLSVTSVIWALYVLNRVGRVLRGWRYVLFLTPLIVFTVICLTNPLTRFVFTIDANNVYSRGPGVYVHWAVSWFYLLYAAVLAFRAMKRAETQQKKQDFRLLLQFIVAPVIAAVAQMLAYGVTSTQVGITISVMLITFRMQDNQISIDELTGINNRRAMRLYVENSVLRSSQTPIFVMMLDINRFKAINDTLGHAVGDQALIDTADALRAICADSAVRLHLCRYGGDEFVISGPQDEALAERLKQEIRARVPAIAAERNRDYTLDISIGLSSGVCADQEDFSHLLRLADESMYEDKKRSKVQAV